MSIDYDGMKNYELYLLKNKPNYYKKEMGELAYNRKMRELEGDDTSTASQSLWNKNRARVTSSNSAQKSDNTFYTTPEDSGILDTNRARTTSGNTNTTLGQSFANDVVNRSAEKSQPNSKPFVPTMTEPIPEYSQPETKPFVPTMTEPIQRYSQPETAGAHTDPYAIPWTEEEEKRKRVRDLQTQQNDLFMLQYGGYITDDIQPQLGAYQAQIDQLNAELNASQGNTNTTLGQSFTNDVVNRAGANGANSSDPYSIPWTEEEEKRKRLHDAQIQRDNLLESMGDNPTMEDIVAWGEYDATIKQLTEELGLGPEEYTPGGKVDGYGLDDEEQEAQVEAENGVNTITGGGAGGGIGGGSWGAKPVEEGSTGDSDIINLIRGTDYYKDILDAFGSVVEDYPNTYEAKVNVDVVSCETYSFSGEEAYEIYQYKEYMNYQKGNKQENLLKSELGDITSVPGAGTIIAGLEYGSYDEEPFWDSDLLGPLEGDYKLATVVMDADYDVIGNGGGKHLYYICYVLYGPDTIEMKDGTTISNPINNITIRPVYEDEYLEVLGGNNE